MNLTTRQIWWICGSTTQQKEQRKETIMLTLLQNGRSYCRHPIMNVITNCITKTRRYRHICWGKLTVPEVWKHSMNMKTGTQLLCEMVLIQRNEVTCCVSPPRHFQMCVRNKSALCFQTGTFYFSLVLFFASCFLFYLPVAEKFRIQGWKTEKLDNAARHHSSISSVLSSSSSVIQKLVEQKFESCER